MKKIFWSIALAISISACDPSIETPELRAGSADFSNYIAIGNSFTAGYSNLGLYPEGQEVSFPNLIAKQLALVGGGEFLQPLMPENGSGYLKLTGVVNNFPVVDSIPPSADATKKVDGPFNNLGIPGIRVKDAVVPGYGLFNPYLNRILASGQEAMSYTQLIGESAPTFFTCWMGSNDVIDYALAGGAFGIEGLPVTGQYGLTPINQFAAAYAALMSAVGDAQGILVSVPDITMAPLFTTIPRSLIPLSNPEDVETLNQNYAPYNMGVNLYNSQVPEELWLRKIEFNIGANFPVVVDQSIPGNSGLPKISQLNNEGFLLLTLMLVPADSLESPKTGGAGWGTAKPIPNQFVITASEAATIRDYVDAYNQIIMSYSGEDIAVYESKDLLDRLTQGMFINGYPVNAKFLEGGVFSLDGVHLTPRGNALVANELIRAINQKFDSTIPVLVETQYPGIDMPF